MNKNIIYTLFMTIDKWPSSTQTPGDFSQYIIYFHQYEICMGFYIGIRIILFNRRIKRKGGKKIDKMRWEWPADDINM